MSRLQPPLARHTSGSDLLDRFIRRR